MDRAYLLLQKEPAIGCWKRKELLKAMRLCWPRKKAFLSGLIPLLYLLLFTLLCYTIESSYLAIPSIYTTKCFNLHGFSRYLAIPCFAYPDAYLSSIPKHLDLPFTTPSQSYSLQLLPKQRMNPTREAYVGYSNPKEKTYSSIEFFLPKSPSMPIGHFPYYSSINE